jgi:peptidoglycan/LPS O-acetylase OafA/YrhL
MRVVPAPAVRLPALTSLRFVAAAMILVLHSQGTFGIARIDIPFALQQGVSFFFVLSGFILTHVYPTLSSHETPRFLRARVARLWPGHLVGFLFCCLVLPVYVDLIPSLIPNTIANLVLVQGWIPQAGYFYSFNAVSWSLSTEVAFYLLFPLLIRNFGRTWALKLGASLVLLCVMVTVANTLDAPPPVNDPLGLRHGLVYINPLARLAEFVFGMTVCLLWQRLRTNSRFDLRLCTIGEVATIMLILALMYISKQWSTPAEEWLGLGGAIWFNFVGCTFVGFGALILFAALGRGLIARALSHPFPILLGEISYSVYLVHFSIVRAFGLPGSDRPAWIADLPAWIAYPAFWLVTLALAYFTWRFIERPARRFLLGGPRQGKRIEILATT